MKWKRRGIRSGKILMQVSSTPEDLDFLDFLIYFFPSSSSRLIGTLPSAVLL